MQINFHNMASCSIPVQLISNDWPCNVPSDSEQRRQLSQYSFRYGGHTIKMLTVLDLPAWIESRINGLHSEASDLIQECDDSEAADKAFAKIEILNEVIEYLKQNKEP